MTRCDAPGERLGGDATFVVTFNPRPVAAPGSLKGLRRMSLADARDLVRLATPLYMRGRIINTETLAEAS